MDPAPIATALPQNRGATDQGKDELVIEPYKAAGCVQRLQLQALPAAITVALLLMSLTGPWPRFGLQLLCTRSAVMLASPRIGPGQSANA